MVQSKKMMKKRDSKELNDRHHHDIDGGYDEERIQEERKKVGRFDLHWDLYCNENSNPWSKRSVKKREERRENMRDQGQAKKDPSYTVIDPF